MKKKSTHVPLMIIPPSFIAKYLKSLRGIGDYILRIIPNLKKGLESAEIDERPSDYILASLLSAIFLTALFVCILVLASTQNEKPFEEILKLTILSTLGIFLIAILVFFKYPSIIAKKKAEKIDRHLIFALKDLVLHTSSGSSLYKALVSVSLSGYGEISEEFETVAREINSGASTDVAIERLAERTESAYLKKILWQVVNSLRAGGNLKVALSTIVKDLDQSQRSHIVSYANELNLWSLIYMLFAVAAPTIGMTMMIILSSFADIGINEAVLILFVGITMVIQIIIISLIKSRRPMVEF